MVLLRRVIGDALRARRQAQHRTLREVSTAANVSLGYLSEIERGQKEPSSELLSAVCEALGAQLSELLREVSHSVETAERAGVPAPAAPAESTQQPAAPEPASVPAASARAATARGNAGPARATRTLTGSAGPVAKAALTRPLLATTVDGDVSVIVHQDGPLRATLKATRAHRPTDRGRDALTAV